MFVQCDSSKNDLLRSSPDTEDTQRQSSLLETVDHNAPGLVGRKHDDEVLVPSAARPI
jgi:hypothetical protein